MSGEHSILPPSSSARRVQCSASTTMEARYPETEESPESRDGTAAHWALAEMLHGRVVAEGQIAPNGIYLTTEMLEAADVMYDDIALELKPYGLVPSQGQIEVPVAIPRIHAQSWGTPDYRIWLPKARPTLLAYDFKFGFRGVDAFENWQMVEYVAGLTGGVMARGVSDEDIDVTVKIVQPRSFHGGGTIKVWSFVASEIRGLINIANHAAHKALGPFATTEVGEECRDCSARFACPTLHQASLTACDMAGAAQPFDLPPEAMALEYRTLNRYRALLDARASGLEQQLLALGKRGAALNGLRIEHGAGRERWTIPEAQVIEIGKALGVDIAKPPAALTPKQALKAGLPEIVLPGLVNTPRGEAKLVFDDGSLARRVFG